MVVSGSTSFSLLSLARPAKHFFLTFVICSCPGFFSRDVVLGGKLLLWGVKNIQKKKKRNLLLFGGGGGGGGGNSKLRGGNFPP